MPAKRASNARGKYSRGHLDKPALGKKSPRPFGATHWGPSKKRGVRIPTLAEKGAPIVWDQEAKGPSYAAPRKVARSQGSLHFPLDKPCLKLLHSLEDGHAPRQRSGLARGDCIVHTLVEPGNFSCRGHAPLRALHCITRDLGHHHRLDIRQIVARLGANCRPRSAALRGAVISSPGIASFCTFVCSSLCLDLTGH